MRPAGRLTRLPVMGDSRVIGPVEGDTMLRLLRIGILLVMFLMAMSLLLAIGAAETGPFEKVVLGGVLVVLLALARPVHRLG